MENVKILRLRKKFFLSMCLYAMVCITIGVYNSSIDLVKISSKC